ncbi:ABC transporter ATP-binding protein [Thermasporomyces composti]|uniref:ABC-type multidrug transport system fused ATPase/permease subunit n=1 Tax=Thermasporomyces composti TaxID=696763 RepID=A0A3D9V560_THECX|nr:ABC transporter ATP-binding protein [Thermasporomyces composti]REF36599.1 ABC-type multidrug transport system fused ATPase/permease subunit [Thermasporomyces composti]
MTTSSTSTAPAEPKDGVRDPRTAKGGVDTRDWRGVAAEQHDDVPEKASLFLRERSRRLLGDLLRPHKKVLLWLVAIVIAENGLRLAIPYLVKVGIDRGIPPLIANEGATTLFTVVAAIVVAAVGQAATRQAFLQLSGRIGQDILLELRRRVFNHFQKLSLGFHEKYTSGRVVSRLTSDIDAIYELLQSGFDGLVSAVLTLVGTAILLLFLDVHLGLVALVPIPILLVFTQWFRRQSSIAYRRTRETVAAVIVHFVESMTGIRAVQAFRREPRNQEIFEELNIAYRDANMRGMRLVAVFMPGVKVIGNLTVAAIMLYGGWLAFHDEVTVGVLAAFLLYLRQFYEPMQEISQFYNTFQSASAALEKLSGVLEEEPDVPEPAKPVPLRHPRGEVRFEGVAFGYRRQPADRKQAEASDQSEEPQLVLPRLDLRIPAGQTVALVGATGAGKTTLAKLLARFYDPLEGRVTLDGVDLRDLDEATLRRAVVMVTQENFLFSGTVADNIRFGRPDASRKEIIAAAQAIGAHEFISALPQGYDTEVGKRGGRLSAGQRQLVAFARAFLANPAVLILDEATSSLDVPSERLVQRALRTILAERTALIIAHRLSTVEIADRVLVMERGRIVEDGPPDQLIARAGRFADLHRAWLDSLA